MGNGRMPCLSLEDREAAWPILRADVNSLKKVGSLASNCTTSLSSFSFAISSPRTFHLHEMNLRKLIAQAHASARYSNRCWMLICADVGAPGMARRCILKGCKPDR